MSTFSGIVSKRRFDQLRDSELRIDAQLCPGFAPQTLVGEHLKSGDYEVLVTHRMMGQKALGTPQFIVAAELVDKCGTSVLVRTLSCVCNSFFDIASVFFGNGIGGSSSSFWSHYDVLYLPFIVAVSTNLMHASANKLYAPACASS
jgi:hypothetical protein